MRERLLQLPNSRQQFEFEADKFLSSLNVGDVITGIVYAIINPGILVDIGGPLHAIVELPSMFDTPGRHSPEDRPRIGSSIQGVIIQLHFSEKYGAPEIRMSLRERDKQLQEQWQKLRRNMPKNCSLTGGVSARNYNKVYIRLDDIQAGYPELITFSTVILPEKYTAEDRKKILELQYDARVQLRVVEFNDQLKEIIVEPLPFRQAYYSHDLNSGSIAPETVDIKERLLDLPKLMQQSEDTRDKLLSFINVGDEFSGIISAIYEHSAEVYIVAKVYIQPPGIYPSMAAILEQKDMTDDGQTHPQDIFHIGERIRVVVIAIRFSDEYNSPALFVKFRARRKCLSDISQNCA